MSTETNHHHHHHHHVELDHNQKCLFKSEDAGDVFTHHAVDMCSHRNIGDKDSQPLKAHQPAGPHRQQAFLRKIQMFRS